MKICKNCVMDSTDSTITFNDDGVCIYCQNFYENIVPNWHIDERGAKVLMKNAQIIKKDGKNREFDCIMGLSGGLDSSYCAYVATEIMGLRPLLLHVDAGWNTDQAVGNIEKIVDGLGLDLYTEVINWEEMKDLQVAVLKSQIPHQDIPQDTAFFSTLYHFAKKHKIKYVLTGGNYSTECIREPEEWGAYPGNDKTFIKNIHNKFGSRALKTFPIIDVFASKIYYTYFLGMKVFKPLDYLPYIKADAEKLLEEKFGWKKFQHKHHESRFTRFFEDYWLPKKFGFDRRKAHFSSLILTNQMTRKDALDRLQEPELDESFLKNEFEYVAHKLDLSVSELEEIFNGKNKTSSSYKSKKWIIDFAANIMTRLGLEKRLYK
ncbi:MAG: LPS biosynthesis protein [Gammaproteobacteria bacterium]|nr:LPS biosynthesis protein [Gammaproteobacteria bacterium]